MFAAWRTLKDHAKARGIKFAINLAYFRRFALKTDYLNRTGKFGKCLTVDRINNLKGYEPGNVQVLTRAKNSEKRGRQDAIRMKHGMKWLEKEAA